MKQGPVEGLSKSKDTEDAWQEGGDSPPQRQCERKGRAIQAGGGQGNDRKDLATDKK
jgi:hypothetical protein